MPDLVFRTLRCAGGSSALLATGAEGAVLLAAVIELETAAAAGGVADAFPARNRHGSRRWRLFDSSGAAVVAEIYVEPVGDIGSLNPGWLSHCGYPVEPGWWIDDQNGTRRAGWHPVRA